MSQETKIIAGIGLISFVILVIAIAFLGRTPTQASNKPVDPQYLVRNDSHKITADSAKVTLVEFGDFQCPACGATFPIVSQILNEYKGKINFVFRNFPLSQHLNAKPAANAAEAAGNQGKYWEMYGKLYQNQSEWSSSTQPIDFFVKYAKELNMDEAKFRQDASNTTPILSEDENDGYAVGINATPTFFINNERFTDTPTYQAFKTKIDSLMK